MGIRKMLEILVIFGGDKGVKGVKANSSDYENINKSIGLYLPERSDYLPITTFIYLK
jgi:hypothetical protein